MASTRAGLSVSRSRNALPPLKAPRSVALAVKISAAWSRNAAAIVRSAAFRRSALVFARTRDASLAALAACWRY